MLPVLISVTLAAATSVMGATHQVMVGQGGIKFVPDSITAAIGDSVAFTFVSTDHTVTQGDFSNPCQPADSSPFNSGFPKSEGETFTIMVNSTDPIYYYCAESMHCQGGMVGAINPADGMSVDDYAKASGDASMSNIPQDVQGGTYGSSSDDTSSSSSVSSGAMTSSAATGTMSSPAPSNSMMSSTGTASGSMTGATPSGTMTDGTASGTMPTSTPTTTPPAGSGAGSLKLELGALAVVLAAPVLLFA